jgi:molybdopterin/thiamine biosynthesis adenylyltransferase
MEFNDDQLMRYSRHIILPEVGGKGQEKIAKAKVFIVGAGGLGCPVGYYLTAAGVGTIALIDNDSVEMSNLQRQIAHSVDTIGMPKVESAKKTFESLNPDVKIVALQKRISKDDILELIRDYDIVVDGSDNFPGHDDSAWGRSLLPLPLRGASSSRSCAVLSGSRRARRATGGYRWVAGDRGPEAHPRQGGGAEGRTPDL